ncbi:DUF2865 domain-containing protein [Bradyrhizobium sp. SYSU BS000235]|uniref:DUF2865 domain-containing protein n=1 Tax=Bradyrhizobium sp. SYSU BS000235 TaxID=3411332 RepID=UPI003C71D17F
MHVSTCLKIASTFALLLFAFHGDLIVPSHAQGACDPFTQFFGGCNPRPAQQSLGYADPGTGFDRPQRVYVYRPHRESATAFCVRTCDGRYFPVAVREGQSSAEMCSNFCPASETKIYRGSSIDEASTDSGKSYSDMPNAFRYRNELVAGCTCNGKDAFGLAPMKVEDDPTLRKGDIVAGADGLMVVGRSRRSAELNFTPAPQSLRAKFGQLPVVAAQ